MSVLIRDATVITLNVVQNLVYQGHAHHVETVLVDGNVVLEDRRIPTVDEKALVDRAQEAASAAWARFAAKYGGHVAP